MTAHIFIRHVPLANTQGICYGRSDLPACTIESTRAAQNLATHLPRWPVISSTATRCIALADPLHKQLGLAEFITDNALLEMDFGQWENTPWPQIDRALLDQWAEDSVNFVPPGGESFAMLIDRLRTFLVSLSQSHIIVTHAGVIRAAHHVIGNMPAADAAQIRVPYSSVIKIA